MAYKDEYEVARLYSEAAFGALLGREFAARRKLSLWLAPPLISKTDPATGRPKKRRFGPWIWPFLRLLAKGKRLRGGPLDPFGTTAERRAERALIETYVSDIEALAADLTPQNAGLALPLSAWPSEARGFGPVKADGLAKAEANRERLWTAFRDDAPKILAAE
jgi:indolepyruvate ferredoxin oxidoreductase